MKTNSTLLLTILTYLLLGTLLSAQDCLPNGITFRTQTDIDTFAMQYPDCSCILGDVLIYSEDSGPDTIYNLQGLIQLNQVKGDLTIEFNKYLVDLVGLDMLQGVGGQFLVKNNTQLLALNGLSMLSSIGGAFDIYDNNSLVDLRGLRRLNQIGGSFLVRYNSNMTSLFGLRQLEETEGITLLGNDRLLTIDALETLDTINGNLSIRSKGLTDLAGLTNLKHLTKNLNISYCLNLESLTGLEHLESIGGDFNLLENNNLRSLAQLERLEKIGGKVEIKVANALENLDGLERIDTLAGLRLQSCDMLRDIDAMRNLKRLNGELVLTEIDRLKEINSFSQLDELPGVLDLSNNDSLTNLNGFSQVKRVGGNCSIHSMPSLKNLDGLKSLERVDGQSLFISNLAQLKSLSGLGQLSSAKSLSLGFHPQLTDILHLQNLDSLDGNLFIWNNDSLQNLAGLHNIIKINGRLDIAENPLLQNLSGLDQLESVGTGLVLRENIALNSINALSNLQFDAANDQEMLILFNEQLALCNIPFICAYIESNQAYEFRKNAVGCNTRTELLEQCHTGEHQLNYFIYYDLNQNQLFDPNEYLIEGTIDIQPGNRQLFFTPNNKSYIFLPPDTYTFQYAANSNPDWGLTTAPEITITLDEDNKSDIVSFGIYPNTATSKLITHITAPRARCGTLRTFQTHLHNQGTTTTSGTLWLAIDESITEVEQYDFIDTTQAPNLYGWAFDNLLPGQSISKKIRLRIPLPNQAAPGQELEFHSFTQFNDANGIQQTDTTFFTTTLRCSYDPNDKLVSPDKTNHFIQDEETLIYTIRFQNTGNDTAYDVVLRDTLDPNLDITSLSILSCSHAKQLTTFLQNERELVFDLPNIYLPDSTADLAGSQGQITYSIRPLADLPGSTLIENTAGIYFDFNPPVITNTTKSIIMPDLINVVREPGHSLFTLSPNPTTGTTHLSTQIAGKIAYQISNVSGKVLSQGSFQRERELDLQMLPAGFYFLNLMSSGQMHTIKVIKR